MKKDKRNKRQNFNQDTHQESHAWVYDYLSIVPVIFLSGYIGYYFAWYVNQLHENDMWFTHIKQVEREISFRTESGLYYSYFKQMVLAPSISQGWYELTHDNRTEHLRTINIVERFNIYQEIFLGIIFKILPSSWQTSLQYVYLYLYAVYGLQAFYMMAMFFTTWMLSGSFMAGVVANAFFAFNRNDMTRVHMAAPLRECTSLPFIYIQIAALTYYFRKNIKPMHEKVCLVTIAISTFCFTITWQFAQFVMLLESFALYGIYVLEFVQPRLLKPVFGIFLGSLTTVCILMYGNDMMYSSLVFSFCVAVLIILIMQNNEPVDGGFLKKFAVAIIRIILVFSLAIILNYTIKKITKVESDEHVFKFVLAKLGYGEALKTRDFDARLYLCNGAFQYLPFNTFSRLTDGVLFPIYAISQVVLLAILVYSYFFKKLRGMTSVLDEYPELVFHAILSVFFGAMAMTTLRMKYLWMPHMCILAAGAFCHKDVWKSCLDNKNIGKQLRFLIRHSIPVILIALVLYKKLPAAKIELSQLRMFKDVDTVNLMEWIKNSTAPEASFAGTMQLMAGVKLCTDRPITNHPHYENKFLRQRTKELYQMYGKRTAADVNKILHEHGANYIILENSICYSGRDVGCRPPDIV